jgi:hypothetical protein
MFRRISECPLFAKLQMRIDTSFYILQICYNETITFICCDETSSFRIWNPEIWKSLVKRMDSFYVSGGHFELCDETRGKICGSIMMTTASMKYRSTFSTFKLQVVRSRPQERLVQSLKQGMDIWMLPNPGMIRKRDCPGKRQQRFWHLNVQALEKCRPTPLPLPKFCVPQPWFY